MLRQLATNWTDLTGGGMGLNLPVMTFGPETQARIFFVGQAVIALVAVAVAAFVAAGRLGFALRCIRQNETAAGMLGLDARAATVVAFAVSAAMAGPAGAIYASYIEPGDAFDLVLTVEPIIMAMLGGVGTVVGPVLGAALFLLLDQTVWASFLSVHAAVLESAATLAGVPATGTSLLVVEQDVAIALDLAREGFVLDRGRIVLSGPSAELAGDRRLREAYLGL